MIEELKTGTTTIGLVCSDGIVLAADKRATTGYFVANKRMTKVHQLNSQLVLTMAGTVSDIQLLVKLMQAELRLKRVRTGRELTTKEAANLLAGMVYANIRKLSVIPGVSHFILGGKDKLGFHLFDIFADGSVTEVDDFISSGSGSVIAYGVLETMYKKNLSTVEGTKLVVKALNAAIQRDVASGNGCDVIVITKDKIKKVLTKELETNLEA